MNTFMNFTGCMSVIIWIACYVSLVHKTANSCATQNRCRSWMKLMFYIYYYRMDVPTLNTFLMPIFTVTKVWNTGETGDIYNQQDACLTKLRIRQKLSSLPKWKERSNITFPFCKLYLVLYWIFNYLMVLL